VVADFVFFLFVQMAAQSEPIWGVKESVLWVIETSGGGEKEEWGRDGKTVHLERGKNLLEVGPCKKKIKGNFHHQGGRLK